MPYDVAAAGPGRGDGDARLDGDLVGVGSDADLDGLAGVRRADLDLLPADHDGSADGDAAGDGRGLGQAGRPGGSGPGSAQPGPGLGRDGAGDSADQDPSRSVRVTRPTVPTILSP